MDHRDFSRFGISDQNPYGFGEGFGDGFGPGAMQEEFQGGFPRGMEQRLYNRLMSDGRYAELDKAKHNAQYRNYLLENYDDEMPF